VTHVLREHAPSVRRDHLQIPVFGLQSESKVPGKCGKRRRRAAKTAAEAMTLPELEQTLVELEEEMLAAAEELRFEYAARVRDEIRDLRREIDIAQANEAPTA